MKLLFGIIIGALLIQLCLGNGITAQFQNYLEDKLAEYKGLGGIIYIKGIPNSPIIKVAAGISDNATGEEMLPSHKFRIGGLSSLFLSVAFIHKLEAENDWIISDLNRNVTEFLNSDLATTYTHVSDYSDAANAFEKLSNYENIKISDLLRQTSLINDYLIQSNIEPLLKAPEKLALSRTFSELMGLIDVATVGTSDQMGNLYHFASTNYLILAKLFHILFEQTYDDYLLNDMGIVLPNTYVPTDETLFSNINGEMAHGYLDFYPNDGELDDCNNDLTIDDVSEIHPSLVDGSGAIISTCEDIVTFGEALFRYRTLLTGENYEKFIGDSIKISSDSNDYFGLGVYLYDDGAYYGLGGNLGGYNVEYRFQPSKSISYCVFTNVYTTHLLTETLSRKIMDSLLYLNLCSDDIGTSDCVYCLSTAHKILHLDTSTSNLGTCSTTVCTQDEVVGSEMRQICYSNGECPANTYLYDKYCYSACPVGYKESTKSNTCISNSGSYISSLTSLIVVAILVLVFI